MTVIWMRELKTIRYGVGLVQIRELVFVTKHQYYEVKRNLKTERDWGKRSLVLQSLILQAEAQSGRSYY